MAAKNHDRAAKFWDDQRDPERAGLQREMALYERNGAELERRWAELTEPNAAQGQTRAAELVIKHTQQGAKRIAGILTQLAITLDRSAGLAEEHAERREQAGRSDDAEQERQAARHARDAAQRARSQAEQWLKLTGEGDA